MKVSNQALVLCTFLIAATLLNDAEASDRGMVRNGRVQRKRKLINIVDDMLKEIKQPSAIEVDIEDYDLSRTLMEMSMSMSMSMPMETADSESGADADAGADADV